MYVSLVYNAMQCYICLTGISPHRSMVMDKKHAIVDMLLALNAPSTVFDERCVTQPDLIGG